FVYLYQYLCRSHLIQLFLMIMFPRSMFFCMRIAIVIFGSCLLITFFFFAKNLPRIPMDFTPLWIITSSIAHFFSPKNIWTIIKIPECHLFSASHLYVSINNVGKLFSF